MNKKTPFDLAPILTDKGAEYVGWLYEIQEATRNEVLEAGVHGVTYLQLDAALHDMISRVDWEHYRSVVHHLILSGHLHKVHKGEDIVLTSGRKALVESGLPIPRPIKLGKKARLNAASVSYMVCEMILRHPDKVITEREAYVVMLEKGAMKESQNPSRLAALTRTALAKGYLTRVPSEEYKGRVTTPIKPGHFIYYLGPKFPDIAYQFAVNHDTKADLHRLFLEITRQADTGNSQQITLRMSKTTARWMLNKVKQELNQLEFSHDQTSH